MIEFDPSKLTVEIVGLTTVSQALGGSISIVDPTRTIGRKVVTTRITVPLAVARAYTKLYKDSRYLIPMVAALVRYEGHVVALERHPLGGFGEHMEMCVDGVEREWVPSSARRIRKDLVEMTSDRKWYFDGRYVYGFPGGLDEQAAIRSGTYLNQVGSFRKIEVDAIDLQLLPLLSDFSSTGVDKRTCLAFVASNGAHAISPPIWKDLSDVGMTQFKKETKQNEMDSEGPLVEDTEEVRKNFDRIDATMGVNLNFLLTAGRAIGNTFGYEYVEPLQFPRLMIELHTVNLPNISKEVKATYNTGITFSQALAWLLGLTRKANTLETHIVMRSLMKYLTKRGIFRLSTFDADRVFQDGMSVDNVPRKELNDLIAGFDTKKISISSLLLDARRDRKAREDARANIDQE